MGRKKKNHKPIDDTFENVLDIMLDTKIENKRIKKKENENEEKPED